MPEVTHTIGRRTTLGLLPSEWVDFGESFPERLTGEEVGGFVDRGQRG